MFRKPPLPLSTQLSIIVFLLFGLISSAAAESSLGQQAQAATNKTYGVVDLSLIRPYSRQLQVSTPYRAPFLANFTKGEKSLVYVAAAHGQGPDHETVKSVRLAFLALSPQIVVIEGLEAGFGLSPKFYQDLTLREEADGFRKAGEPILAAHMAMKANVPFVGAEPGMLEIYDFLEARGYTERDVTAFTILRNIPYWVQRDNINDRLLDARIEEFVDRWRYYGVKNIPKHARLTPSEFRDWFARHNARGGASPVAMTSNDLSPLATSNATWFQRLAAMTGEVREHSIDIQIGRLLQQYDRVLVVYGEAHLLKSLLVFEKLMGAARFTKY